MPPVTKVKLQGIAGKGGNLVVTAGQGSTTTVIKTYPGCTVTIYDSGTVTLSSLWSDAGGLTVKANPFTAASDGSWWAYLTPGRYDVRFSGLGITLPFTLSDFLVSIGVTPGIGVLAALPTTTTILEPLVAADSPIIVVGVDPNITGNLKVPQGSIVPGVSFDVASDNGADFGDFVYFLYGAAPGSVSPVVVAGTIVNMEEPTGALDGVNLTYVLAHVPLSSSEEVITTGTVGLRGTDYTILGNTITRLAPPLDVTNGDWIRVSYRY